MTRVHRTQSFVALTTLLLAAAPVSAFGQFWKATASELLFHRNLTPTERNRIYTAVFTAVDSLVKHVWGTPAEWAKLRGDSLKQDSLTLVLDPRIWDGNLLTNPSIIGAHDPEWITSLRNQGMIAGPCSVSDEKVACSEGKASMSIMLSSISPDGRHRAAVRLTMFRRGKTGEGGFLSEWTFRLALKDDRWQVAALEMGPIS